MFQQRLVSTPTAQLWTWGCNNPPAGELTPPELHLQPNTRRPHQVPEGWTRWLSNVENHGEKSGKAFGTLEGQVRQSLSCWSSPKMHYPQATPELRCHGDAVEHLLHHTTPVPPEGRYTPHVNVCVCTYPSAYSPALRHSAYGHLGGQLLLTSGEILVVVHFQPKRYYFCSKDVIIR